MIDAKVAQALAALKPAAPGGAAAAAGDALALRGAAAKAGGAAPNSVSHMAEWKRTQRAASESSRQGEFTSIKAAWNKGGKARLDAFQIFVESGCLPEAMIS